jgi:hypothetical protein
MHGNAVVVYESVTYKVKYVLDGSSIEMTIGEDTLNLTYNSKIYKMSGYLNDDYANPSMSYSFASIGKEAGEYTDGDISVILDGFFTANITAKESVTMNYFKVSDTLFVLYDADFNLEFITISGSTLSFTTNDEDLSGIYYSAGSKNTKWDSWIFTPDGYIVYKFKEIGTYTYESNVLKVKYKQDTELHEVYLSSDKKIIEMEYNCYGSTYNYLFKQDFPLCYSKAFYNCVIFTSDTESTNVFTTYLLDNGYILVFEYKKSFSIFAKPTTAVSEIVVGTTFEIVGKDGKTYIATAKDNEGSIYIKYKIKG